MESNSQNSSSSLSVIKKKIKNILAFRKDKGLNKQQELDKKLVLNLSKSRIPNLKQIKQLPIFLSIKERKIIWALLAIIIICALFWGLSFYSKNLEDTPAKGGEYVEGLIGKPQYVNPVLAQTSDVDSDVSRLLFSGLFKYNNKQELIPDLVSTYEISEDNKTYTLHVEKNVFWHDDKPLTVDDILFTVEVIQDPDFKSPLAVSLSGIRVEKIDEQTIQFILPEPFAPFLDILTFGVLPKHIWENIPTANFNLAEYNLKPIGSGPFKFKSLIKDKLGNIRSYTITRNETFYNRKPYLEQIIFKFFPDFQSAIEALKNKSIQGISYLPKEYKEEIRLVKSLQIHSLKLSQHTAIFFNPKNNETLKDLNIRTALALSINKEEVIQQTLGGEGKIIHGPILSGFLGYHEEIKKYEYDPEKAKEILEENDWKTTEENFRKKDEQELKITLTTVDQPTNIKAIELIKTYWQEIGVKTDLQIIAKNKIQKETIKPRNYEVLLYGEILGTDPDPYPFWHSSQIESPGLNLSLFANKRVDELIEEARQITDPQIRSEKYIQFQDILAAELPAIFLYSPTYTYVLDQRIKGFDVMHISIPADRFNNLEEWYVKTKKTFKR